MKILYLPNCWSQQRQKEKARWIYPVLLAMQAEYYRKDNHEVRWYPDCPFPVAHLCNGVSYDKVIREPENIPFLSLPHPNRVFTNAFDERYQNNGNFKYHPGTYIQAASSCWYGRCSFCVENGKPYEVREVDDVIREIKKCKALGFEEVFDDSGTFPVGAWLDDFLRKLRAINSIRFSCNMRMVDCDYEGMRAAGFRMLLFGLESANQQTLDKINKGVKVDDVKYIVKAAHAGLDCHVAYMVSYPWETLEEELNTIKTVQWLLKKGYAKTAQCSVYKPPNGEIWNKREYLTRKLYDVAFMPEFWYNKVKDLKNIEDWKYLLRGIKEGVNTIWGKK